MSAPLCSPRASPAWHMLDMSSELKMPLRLSTKRRCSRRGVTLPQNVCGWGVKVPACHHEGILSLALFKFRNVNSPFTLA